MAFTQRRLDALVSWVASAPQLAEEREAAQAQFFGDDDPRPVNYWGGTQEPISRHRRFLGYFLFTHRLPDGQSPAELGATAAFQGREREEALEAVRGARYVMAVVRSVLPGQAVFLALERERFEIRDRTWSYRIAPEATVYAHLVPSRRGVWLLGPGWLEMPFRLGPGIRSHLRDLQSDPIGVERLLQSRSTEEEENEELPRSPQDATLEEAVARMTDEAEAAGRETLIMPSEEWEALVVRFMTKLEATAFSQEIIERVGAVEQVAELNRWLALANNIWNNTPQPDRGGKTPNELIRELRRP